MLPHLEIKMLFFELTLSQTDFLAGGELIASLPCDYQWTHYRYLRIPPVYLNMGMKACISRCQNLDQVCSPYLQCLPANTVQFTTVTFTTGLKDRTTTIETKLLDSSLSQDGNVACVVHLRFIMQFIPLIDLFRFLGKGLTLHMSLLGVPILLDLTPLCFSLLSYLLLNEINIQRNIQLRSHTV